VTLQTVYNISAALDFIHLKGGFLILI